MHRLLLLALLTSAGIATAGPLVTPEFRASFLSQDLDFDPGTLFVGDIDHDGRYDAVTVNRFGEIHCLFGRADGSFQPGPVTPGTVQNQDLRETRQGGMYDFNQDGQLDLALLVRPANTTSIQMWLGDGTGHFGPQRTIVTGSFGDAVFGEFTGDGWLDVAATRPATSELAIFAGTAAGLFPEVQVFKIKPVTSGFGLYARDFDGDGRDDVAWGGTSIRLYRGQAGGGFAAPLAIHCPGLGLIGGGDFDGDGRLDLVAQSGPEGYMIFRGDGAGGFDPGTYEPTLPNVPFFRVGDTDGDGKDEILNSTNTTIVQPVDGQSGVVRAIPLRGSSFLFEVADVDGDGSEDFVMLDAASITTVYGPPTGAGITDVATGALPNQVVLADLDRDGNLDAITPDSGSDQVTVLWGDGTGGFPARTDLPVGQGPDALAVTFLDSDAWPDLLISEQTAGTLGVIRGSGGRAFTANASIPSGSKPRGVAAGDVTGDGQADAVVAFDLANQVKVFPGDGAGNLGPAIPITTGSAPQFPTVVDVDNDGLADVVYALRITQAVGVRFGQPDGTLGPEMTAPAAGKTTRYCVFDFDHDGLLDFASIGDFNSTIRLAHNAGGGTFQAYADILPPTVSEVAPGDFDGDGVPEVAFLEGQGAGVIGMNAITGPGVLPASKNVFGAGATGTSFATGDLDHDGRPDFVVASKANSAVSVVLNRHTGTIVGVEPVPSGPSRLRFASRMPARGEFALAYDAPSADEGRLRVLTARGTVVFQAKILPNAAGAQLLRVAPTGLRGGVYWAEVTQGPFRDVVKFVFVP